MSSIGEILFSFEFEVFFFFNHESLSRDANCCGWFDGWYETDLVGEFLVVVVLAATRRRKKGKTMSDVL